MGRFTVQRPADGHLLVLDAKMNILGQVPDPFVGWTLENTTDGGRVVEVWKELAVKFPGAESLAESLMIAKE